MPNQNSSSLRLISPSAKRSLLKAVLLFDATKSKRERQSQTEFGFEKNVSCWRCCFHADSRVENNHQGAEVREVFHPFELSERFSAAAVLLSSLQEE